MQIQPKNFVQRLFVTRAGFDNLEDMLGNKIALMIMGIDTSEATELNGASFSPLCRHIWGQLRRLRSDVEWF